MSSIEDADALTFESVLLLYLACGKMTDGDLDEREAAIILERARAHTPGLPESYAASVLEEVARDFQSSATPEAMLNKVVLAAERVGERLDDDAQAKLIEDLISITEADGVVVGAERDFVLAVGRTFGIDVDFVDSPEDAG